MSSCTVTTCLSKINWTIRLAWTVYDTPSPAKILGRDEAKSGGLLAVFRTEDRRDLYAYPMLGFPAYSRT